MNRMHLWKITKYSAQSRTENMLGFEVVPVVYITAVAFWVATSCS
jgi:hypothetical protein